MKLINIEIKNLSLFLEEINESVTGVLILYSVLVYDNIKIMAPEIQIFLLAMTPIGELRTAIPMGLIFYNLNPVAVYFLSVLGNIFVVFLVFVFLNTISGWSFFNRFFGWLLDQTRKKHYDKVNKYGLWFLPFFVAIPLPATGGWTASLIAFVFGMPFKKAFLLISLGILVAGLIVLFLTKAGISIEKQFGWQALIGIALILGFIYWLLPKNKTNFLEIPK